MTTPQTSFLSEIRSDEPLSLHTLVYLRQRTKNRLYDYVLRKFIDEQSRGLTKAQLARRIGKRPEVVNRLLGTPGNWTIDTLSDLLAGISAEEIEPHSVSLLERPARNDVGPDWLRQLWFDPTKKAASAASANDIAWQSR